MNWETIFTTIWSLLNSAMGVAVVAGVVLYILNKVYGKKPDWKKYEGTIIAAVKWAEKQIPDDSPNKAAARLDEALKYVLKIHAEVENRQTTAAELAVLREGIQIVHAELEAKDGLTTAVKTALILMMVGLLAFGGCTGVYVSPGAGPVSVGAASSLVSTEGQQTKNKQGPVDRRHEKPGPTTQPVSPAGPRGLETLSDVESHN
ncbi:MAG: hypothetical protein WC378_15140 [Opitutaceae bacterium]|jgi:hypothetical protein